LVVEPKIPTSHLLYLFGRSGAFPRLDEQAGAIAADDSLWELVATWFVAAFEKLLRRDLVRDYEEATDDLRAARGRIEPGRTADHYYAGRLEFACRFDEFELDSPLNRVLLAATRSVAGSPVLRPELRRRARRLEAHLEDVGDLRSGDVLTATDRRTAHYADSIALARSLLRSTGRSLAEGASSAWTFLIRTPEMVEAGIRAVLTEHLGAGVVRKEGRQLQGSSLTFNPDLVFGPPDAVGDVKYKLAGGDWDRADLYQVIAFAAAFRVTETVLVRFRRAEVALLADVRVGDIGVREVTWPADDEIPAAVAAGTVAEDVRAWLGAVRGLRAVA
jgi:5-methylcytosine-specific restriction endonuclease McrBC regulatory subunit McrC